MSQKNKEETKLDLYCSECGRSIVWIPEGREYPEKMRCVHCNKVVELTDKKPEIKK